MIQLNYRDTRPIYSQIVDGFRSQIATGILQNGEKLPSVRELASTLAINPNTIQRAYRELEAGGWIVTVAGKGCFVCGTPEEAAPQLQTLWDRFDETVEALRLMGISRKELLERIQGGKGSC